MRVLALVLIASTAAAPALADTAVPTFTPQMLATARANLDDSLNDYPSTRFKDVHIVPGVPDVVLCGQMNGKNRMGAYTGWAPFFVHTQKDKTIAALEGELVVAGEPTPVERLANEVGSGSVHPKGSAQLVQDTCSSAVALDDADHSAELAYRAP